MTDSQLCLLSAEQQQMIHRVLQTNWSSPSGYWWASVDLESYQTEEEVLHKTLSPILGPVTVREGDRSAYIVRIGECIHYLHAYAPKLPEGFGTGAPPLLCFSYCPGIPYLYCAKSMNRCGRVIVSQLGPKIPTRPVELNNFDERMH